MKELSIGTCAFLTLFLACPVQSNQKAATYVVCEEVTNQASGISEITRCTESNEKPKNYTCTPAKQDNKIVATSSNSSSSEYYECKKK